ncbi:BON domain-containing protein [Agriterribacter sp.]|uniref:BON domain-containing protein n=1 Tax=Agriterribacter sp. TaxID=2821509 RepID=UPI002BE4599B|nr:BON domain-containing protein [Agriterribacter sp.]HTN06363.1 BON domain-containing protein [Agriterribacter sp.]
MKKAFFRLLRVSMFVAMASIWLFSCKPKISDQDIEAKIQSNATLSHLAVSVKDGVVTLNGEAKDQADRMDCEAAAKSIAGVKQVINNTTIAPPPPPAPVVIAADDPLTKGIADALKDFPTVKATAADGIITVTGETTAANWKKIKMALDGLQPKKVDAAALKIK